jgi:hypothetical protein
MNTNSKVFRAHVKAHILQGVYDYAGEDSDTARACHIWAMFNSAYNYPDNVKRIPNTQARVAEWLAGLPLNIAFADCDILELSESWHGAAHDEKTAERVVANWFNLLAMHLLRIWSNAGINPHVPGPQGCAACYA